MIKSFTGKGDHITMLPFISGRELVLLVILQKGNEVCIIVTYHDLTSELRYFMFSFWLNGFDH